MGNQEEKSSITNRLKQKCINFKARLKRSSNWNLKYARLKYFKVFNNIKLIPRTIITVILYTSAIWLFICYISGNNSLHGVLLNINKINLDENFNPADLVIQQISMTLLVLTIVSLISNIDNKYIYGEKAIEVIFSKKGIFSISSFFNALIFLMLINLAILIKGGKGIYIIWIFLIAVLIIAFITFKFTTIFTNPEKIKIKLQSLYLKENEKHIHKATPLEANLSVKLETFKNVTVECIKTGDLRHIENINMYFELLKISLFNNKELIQEYYTERIRYGDFVAHIAFFAEILYKENKFDESMIIYNSLYNILNYHEVVLISDIETNGRVTEYINLICDAKTKIEIKDLHYKIFPIIKNYWEQIYLYTTVDLSYCRLAKSKHNLIYYFAHCDILEKYYCAIFENKNLNNEEKKKSIMYLYDSVRVLRCDNTFECYTVRNFKRKEMFNEEERIYPNYLYAEPIALMILKIIENKDIYSFKLFMTMNLDDELMNYIKVLCIMSLIEAVIRGEKKYLVDIAVTYDELDKVLKIINIPDIKFKANELYLLYSNFIELYSKENKKKKSNKEHVYSFHPRLRFNIGTIKSVFYYIAIQNNIDQENEEIYSLKSEISTSIMDILYKYQEIN